MRVPIYRLEIPGQEVRSVSLSELSEQLPNLLPLSNYAQRAHFLDTLQRVGFHVDPATGIRAEWQTDQSLPSE